MIVLIIEDEEPASDRLVTLVGQIDPELKVAAVAASVRQAVDWLKGHPSPDLIIMDVQLADGLSFEIFDEAEIQCPVIFTTAHHEFAVKAFKVNSIDYLLKPVKKDELAVAIHKFRTVFHRVMPADLKRLADDVRKATARYQKRIVIRFRDMIKVIDLDDAAYFFTSDKVVFLSTSDGSQYPVDHTLDELELMLDPNRFFRINRQFIVSFVSIARMVAWSKSRIKLDLQPPVKAEAIVSTERSPAFKEWLLGKG